VYLKRPEARQHSEKGRLAAAVGAHNKHRPAGWHVKGQLSDQRRAIWSVQGNSAEACTMIILPHGSLIECHVCMMVMVARASDA